METRELPVFESVDMRKIETGLWHLTGNTLQVEQLCDQMAELFTTEERSNLSFLRNDRLKCFSLYAKILEEENYGRNKLLLQALHATGNLRVAEQIQTRPEDHTIPAAKHPVTISRLEGNSTNEEIPGQRRPRIIRYDIDGKNTIHSTPEMLHIPAGLQNIITVINLNNMNVPLNLLKKLLSPCASLEDLRLENVLLNVCPPHDECANQESPVVLPRLKSYSYSCDAEVSALYAWNTLIFFSHAQTENLDLLKLWKGMMKVEVRSHSMEIVLDENNFLLRLPKKEFYDAPNFVPYIPKESVLSVLRNLINLITVECLLPKNFVNVEFTDLPNSTKNFRVSGLEISYSDRNCRKLCEGALFENCTLPQAFLDDVHLVFPKARKVSFQNCRFDNCESADLSISFSD